MQLTRRDAVAALAAAGVAVGGGGAALAVLDDRGSSTAEEGDAHTDGDVALEEAEIETLVAAAEVLYPSEVEDVETFVRRYVRGRAADRPAHATGMAEAAAYLDDYAEAWHGRAFSALDPAARESALDRMEADVADPVPDGSDVERVRYYVVNELLFALYSTPTGGRLVGLENPQGHPGGLTSYRRGPQS